MHMIRKLCDWVFDVASRHVGFSGLSQKSVSPKLFPLFIGHIPGG